MKKDINFHIAENVEVVAMFEWDEEFLSRNWNIYLINGREETINTVLVLSRGNSDDRKTSVLRHGLGNLNPSVVSKVERITPDVLGFTNEYLVTFFFEGKLYERNFVFPPNSISEEKLVELKLIEGEGILAI